LYAPAAGAYDDDCCSEIGAIGDPEEPEPEEPDDPDDDGAEPQPDGSVTFGGSDEGVVYAVVGLDDDVP